LGGALAWLSLFSGSGCQLVGYEVIVGPGQTNLDGAIAASDAGAADPLDATGGPGAVAVRTGDADSHGSESGSSAADAGHVDTSDAAPLCAGPSNACGGCSVLAPALASSCGQCGLGHYTCAGTNALVCADGDALPVASTSSLLIDDFEDGDSIPLSGSGTDGYWYVYTDHTAGTLSPPDGDRITPAYVGAAGTLRSAHVVGGGFTAYGAGLILWPNLKHCAFDVSALRGISFWVKGTSSMTLSLATPQTLDPKYCGTSCNDFYSKTYALTTTWTPYQVAWSSLKQAGWGTPAAFVPSQVEYFQFSFGANVDFELYLDEVGFY
jgi:hypothetical protein